MTEDENYADIDISDVVEDTDLYIDNSDNLNPIEESEQFSAQESEIFNSEDQLTEEKRNPTQHSNKVEVIKNTRLPMARIKNIMKMDPDVNQLNHETVFLVTKATELFLETIIKETYSLMSKKKKTITKQHLDHVINVVDCLCFLEGAMDF